jgi:hypothetical protein
MGRSFFIRGVLICCLVAVDRPAIAQHAGVREIPLPLDSLLSSDVVLARVGPTVVTVREFMATSVFGPAFVKRQPETRKRTLEFIINEKLLALTVRGDQNDPRVLSTLEVLEGDFATEELFRDDVLAHVSVSEGEEQEAMTQQLTMISLRWLYRKDERPAAALSRQLRAGISFDTLYRREVVGSAITRDDRGMRATLFEIRRRNPAMAQLAQRIAVGHASDPVKGPDGFYVLRIDSLTRNVIQTETALSQLKSDVRRALMKMKADSLSDLYVRSRMRNADPVIERPVFDLLRAYLGSRILSREKFKAFDLAKNLQSDASDFRNIENYGDRSLVKLSKGSVTLGEFLTWYRVRETNMSFRTNAPQAFFLSVEDVIWRMVRDRLLVKAAYDRGLQRRPGVTTQLRWWNEKLLYQVAKDSIKKTIGWSDTTLRDYYTQQPGSFRDSSGRLRPFDQVKDDVLREWYEGELAWRVLRALNRAKQQFPVTVDEGALKSIPVDAENDPRAIEVYAVKKGGTFARPAFPTIDTFWQSWQ